MKTATIKLTGEPLMLHGQPVTEIVLREPRGAELFSIGDVYVRTQHIVNDTVSMTPAVDDDAVRAYLERCLVSPGSTSVLDLLGLQDAIKVRRAMLDFFTPDEPTTSETPATGSSSGQESQASPKSVN